MDYVPKKDWVSGEVLMHTAMNRIEAGIEESFNASKGDQGDTGPQGIQGLQGEIGPHGDQGLKGDDGDIGSIGEQGPQGIQGLQGPSGPQGLEGLVGPVGPAGLTWRGEYNNQSSYVMDDAVAYQGATYFCLQSVTDTPPLPSNTFWALLAAQGARGEKGDSGDNGAQGIQGISGQQGVRGVAGEQGLQGAQGERGLQGQQGLSGVQGVAGVRGIQGEKGDAGLYYYNGSFPGLKTQSDTRYINLPGNNTKLQLVLTGTKNTTVATGSYWIGLKNNNTSSVTIAQVLKYENFETPANNSANSTDISIVSESINWLTFRAGPRRCLFQWDIHDSINNQSFYIRFWIASEETESKVGRYVLEIRNTSQR